MIFLVEVKTSILLTFLMATWAFNLSCNMFLFESEGVPVPWTCLTCGLVCHEPNKKICKKRSWKHIPFYPEFHVHFICILYAFYMPSICVLYALFKKTCILDQKTCIFDEKTCIFEKCIRNAYKMHIKCVKNVSKMHTKCISHSWWKGNVYQDFVLNPGKTQYFSFICEILKKLTSKTCSKRNLLQARLTLKEP